MPIIATHMAHCSSRTGWVLTQVLYNVVYSRFEQCVHRIWTHSQHALWRPLHKVHTVEERQKEKQQELSTEINNNRISSFGLGAVYKLSSHMEYYWETWYYRVYIVRFYTAIKVSACVPLAMVSSKQMHIFPYRCTVVVWCRAEEVLRDARLACLLEKLSPVRHESSKSITCKLE